MPVKSGNYPEWYQTQGFFNLIDCGPTVAAMASSWAGVPLNRHQARAHYPSPAWWNFSHIEQTLNAQGVAVERLPVAMPALGELAIYHVDGVHFVVVAKASAGSDLLRIYDPLGSVSVAESSELRQRITQPVYLNITRPL